MGWPWLRSHDNSNVLRKERNSLKNAFWSWCKASAIFVLCEQKTNFVNRFLVKLPSTSCNENPSSGNRVVSHSERRVGNRIERHTDTRKLIGALEIYANACNKNDSNNNYTFLASKVRIVKMSNRIDIILWQWHINRVIHFLNIIHCPNFYCERRFGDLLLTPS
jgi:hypothetical protein